MAAFENYLSNCVHISSSFTLVNVTTNGASMELTLAISEELNDSPSSLHKMYAGNMNYADEILLRDHET